MICKTFFAVMAALILCAAPAANAIDSEFITAGRAIAEQYKDSVVTVRAVITLKFQGQEQERKQDVIGTVIGADGLTAVALSSIDPAAFLGGMSGSVEVETVISSLDILKPDGSEIKAVEVIRDPDLDLAFVRPATKPEEPMTHVDLTKAGDAEILDYVVVLNRLGQIANRVNAATFEQIEGVVRRPRTFYVPSSSVTGTNQGCVAFNLDGEVVGLFVLRRISAGAGASNDDVAGIILPAADILDGASQVPPFEE